MQQLALPQIFAEHPEATAYFVRIFGGDEQKGKNFVLQLLRVYAEDQRLQFADPREVFNAAVTAAELDLPLHKVFKTAYIIPTYHDKAGKWFAQFVIGYKGLRLLAQRTGEFKRIVAVPVYDGQIVRIDPVKGSKFNFAFADSDKIVGFYAYIETHNGFRDEKFWTDAQMRRHASLYSQDYHNPDGIWHTNYAGMGKKTILKALLNESAPLYQQVQVAIAADHSVNDTPVERVLDGRTDDNFLSAAQVSYPDNPAPSTPETDTPSAETGKMPVDDELMQNILANIRANLLSREQVAEHYALTEAQQAVVDAAFNFAETAAAAETGHGQPAENSATDAASARDDAETAAPPAPEQQDGTSAETAPPDSVQETLLPENGEIQAVQPEGAEPATGTSDPADTPAASPKTKTPRKRKAAPPAPAHELPIQAADGGDPAPANGQPAPEAQPETDDTPPPLATGEVDEDEGLSAAIVAMKQRWEAQDTAQGGTDTGETAATEAGVGSNTPTADRVEEQASNAECTQGKDRSWTGLGDMSASNWSAVIPTGGGVLTLTDINNANAAEPERE